MVNITLSIDQETYDWYKQNAEFNISEIARCSLKEFKVTKNKNNIELLDFKNFEIKKISKEFYICPSCNMKTEDLTGINYSWFAYDIERYNNSGDISEKRKKFIQKLFNNNSLLIDKYYNFIKEYSKKNNYVVNDDVFWKELSLIITKEGFDKKNIFHCPHCQEHHTLSEFKFTKDKIDCMFCPHCREYIPTIYPNYITIENDKKEEIKVISCAYHNIILDKDLQILNYKHYYGEIFDNLKINNKNDKKIIRFSPYNFNLKSMSNLSKLCILLEYGITFDGKSKYNSNTIDINLEKIK